MGKRRRQPRSEFLIRGRGPGFIVWLSAPNARVSGFITWAETGVAELSPAKEEAWRFPTLTAANTAARRAFGPAIERYEVRVSPERS